jgi:starch phosphorylase
MDGANVEICEAVGRENMFIFGMTVEEVKALVSKGYRPSDYLSKQPGLQRIISLIRDGFFSYEQQDLFKPIVDNLNSDAYMIMADFQSYKNAQTEAAKLFANKNEWTVKTIRNIAKMGMFSSDRAIAEYASKIWGIEPMEVSDNYEWRKLVKAH